MYENVKNITGSRFRSTFDLFVKELEDYGYNVYWKVLNAKHYGIPQNRERVYCVIIRKDLDNGKFQFPKPVPLQRRLADMLEDQVDERYYLSDEKVAAMIAPPRELTPETSYCLDANYYKGTTLDQFMQKKRRQLVCAAQS